jgi:hypothetical protein
MLLSSGSLLSYLSWQERPGGELEAALGAFLLAVGGLVVLYGLAFPRQ